MSREYKLYLNDIQTAIERIEHYVQGFDLEAFRDSQLIIDAVIRNFTVIGEAARNIPEEVRVKYDDVPWRAIGSFRNLLVHEYFRVDLEQTWSVIQGRLPKLKAQITAILEQEDDGETT